MKMLSLMPNWPKIGESACWVAWRGTKGYAYSKQTHI
jgi:hypothetical protein